MQQQIARIEVGGFIAGSQRMADLFKRVGEAGSVSGVVISINSPGGTTTGAEELYRGIRQLADKKPLVAFVDGTAASGGYITALAADHIVARETSLVGSIGVLFQYPDVSKLLDTVGVQVQEIKSAPLKAEPSPFHPTSPEARAALAGGRRRQVRLVQASRGVSAASLTRRNWRRLDRADLQGPAALVKLVDADRRRAGSDRLARAREGRRPICRCAIGGRATKRSFNLWTAARIGAEAAGLRSGRRTTREARRLPGRSRN